MKRTFFKTKKMRYGSVSAMLTVMVIVVAILVNVVCSSVVERYEWNPSMIKQTVFDVSEDCHTLLDNAFARASDERGAPAVEILFCDVEENVSAYSSVNYYLYHTATELAKRHGNIKITCLDIVANPAPIKEYMYTVNPLTGEKIDIDVSSDSIIVISEGYHRVYAANEFYVYSTTDSQNAWGYSGERELAAALMNAVSNEKRIACLLNNHGEVHYDYELLNLINDAGYTVVYLDLYKDPIPENCDLIISYNPNTDLLTDKQLSDTSEMDILDAFLKEEGNTFLVFLSNATPKLPNFESYLESWGVATDYSEKNTAGATYRYTVEDSANSLTGDGYTIYGQGVENAPEAFMDSAVPYVVFRNATSLSVTTNGYLDLQNGSYQSMDGTRILYPLYRSSNASKAYANGSVVDDGPSVLMSVTEQKNAGGSSYVGVVSSVQFGVGDYLQSAVYGNSDVLLQLFSGISGNLNTKGLGVKPFLVETISTVTTSEILTCTLILALSPALIATGTALVILVRRRRRI